MANDINIRRGSDGELVWFLKEHCCYQAATALGAIDDDGKTCGDQGFVVTKESLNKFKHDIIYLDFHNKVVPDWVYEKVGALDNLINAFDFENGTLVVTTDW